MAKKLVLSISGQGGEARDVVKEDAGSVIIGSGAAAAIQVEDPEVAGLHCMIKAEGDELTAIDLGSSSGTRVGGKKISAPTVLRLGSVVEIGKTSITVVAHGEKAQAEKSVASNASGAAFGASGNAARLFNEELPPEEQPSQDSKQLEVAMLWGDTIINVRHFPDDVLVRIGAGRGNDFSVFASSLGDSFPLATCKAGNCHISVPPGAGIVLRRNGTTRHGEKLASDGELKAGDGAVQAQQCAMQLRDRVQVTVDNVSFVIRWTKPHKLATAGASGFDFYFTKVLTTTGMAGIVLLAAIFMTDINAESLSEDLFKNPQRFAKLVIKPPEKEKKKLELKLKEKVVKQEKVEDKYGQYTKKDDAKQRPGIDVNKREQDRKKVMSAGLLGLLGGGDGATSNVFGQGGLGTGINQALGSLKSDSGISDSGGVGGLGSRGTGPGGGGTGLGLGGLGTKGGGRGGRGGYGSIDLGGRGKSHTRVVPGKTTVTGSCERSIIGKVINRHANEIRYCYEVELNKDPNLAGKVAVSFTIDPAGAVGDANIAETTVGNNTVEQCILSRIRRWRFPEPKGGGVCVINYPWVFKPAGGEDGEE